MHSVITTQEYIVLSSLLNTQYLKKNVDYWNILALMTGERKFPVCEQVLFDSLVCLELGYNRSKRVLGTFSIFHPVRTAALLIRAGGRITPVDILSALFHDWNEDILPRTGGFATADMSEEWPYVQHGLETVVNLLPQRDGDRLNRNITFLAKDGGESYREYIFRLVKMGKQYPMLVRIKLADRLDNNLELRLDLPGSLEIRDRYRFVFENLFINLQESKNNHTPPHKVESEISGDRRFKALYKNILLLSAVRKQALNLDENTDQLFFSLAESSLNEALYNITHVFDFHLTDTKKKKKVLNKIMNQCDREGIPNASAQSDWQWPKIFCAPDLLTDKKKERKILSRLYQDKTLMAEVAFEFMMIFYLFMYQPDFSLDIM